MESRGKKIIYWIVYILLLLGGMAAKIWNILPIKTTSIFLFGLMWLWTGISLAYGANPYYAQKYERRSQLVFAMSSVGLGIGWTLISLTSLSAQAIPMVLISAPFVFLDMIMFCRNKTLKD